MGYKVGDKVILRDDLDLYNKWNIWEQIRGTELMIKEVGVGKAYHKGEYVGEVMYAKGENGITYTIDEGMIKEEKKYE